MVGVGHGGTDEYVGPFTYRKCIQHCTDMRKNDKSVNGVTMPLHGTGCFCEHNMTSIGMLVKKTLLNIHLALVRDVNDLGKTASNSTRITAILRFEKYRTLLKPHSQVKKHQQVSVDRCIFFSPSSLAGA